MRLLPDGLTGAIMAVEGVSDAAVLLHGPGGCRIRHMVVSSAVNTREGEGTEYSAPYFFGYPRVPATYLDEQDYIAGAYGKSKEGLETVRKRSPALIAVIDSPGASLIGDDHDGAIKEAEMQGIALHLSEPGASVPVTAAFDRTIVRIMEFLSPKRNAPRPETVNILGLSLMDKDWKAVRKELCGYLADMGLTVISCPGANSSVAELTESVNAEFNIVICPEMCAETAKWYEDVGVKTIRSLAGAPVGFDATETWIHTIAEATGKSPDVPLNRIGESRKDVYDKFTGMRYNALRIRGLTFSVAAIASVARPLTEWLYSYLAMAPAAVMCDSGSDDTETEKLKRFLDSAGFGNAWGKEPVRCGAVFCEGMTALSMAMEHECDIGVPIGYSTMGLDDVIPRPVYGVQGAMYVLDELLHGVRGSRSHLSRLEQPPIQSVERNAPGNQRNQTQHREVQEIRETRSPDSLAGIRQREAVQDCLEIQTQIAYREERPAQEGHRKNDETVERSHCRVVLRNQRGRHSQQ